VIDDHGNRADLAVDGGFEHPPPQRLDELPVSRSQEASLGRVPLDLLACRNAQIGHDIGQILGERSQALLGEDRRREGEKVPDASARRISLLAVVQERYAHPAGLPVQHMTRALHCS